MTLCVIPVTAGAPRPRPRAVDELVAPLTQVPMAASTSHVTHTLTVMHSLVAPGQEFRASLSDKRVVSLGKDKTPQLASSCE